MLLSVSDCWNTCSAQQRQAQAGCSCRVQAAAVSTPCWWGHRMLSAWAMRIQQWLPRPARAQQPLLSCAHGTCSAHHDCIGQHCMLPCCLPLCAPSQPPRSFDNCAHHLSFCESSAVCRNVLQTLKVVLQEGGTRGLWRGTGPTVVRLAFGAGINFVALENLKHFMLEVLPQGSGQLGYLQAAAVGGEGAAVMQY